MASSGKKGKKNKGKVISLQSFLSNGDSQVGVTQVAKKVRSRGNESDEDDTLPQIYQLPTAPRASRTFDDDSVPHKPPFLAYISNLPFDVKEDDIYEFFDFVPIISLRLPREDGETGRVRGFGYIEFDTREDLIQVISLPDPHIKNRRVRIDVSNENEQQQGQKRGSNNRSRYDGFGASSENRDSTNWRRDNDSNKGEDDKRGGYDRNRGYNRERPRDGSQDNSSWRTGERSNLDSSPRRGGGYERFRGVEERGSTRRPNDDFRRGPSRSDDEVPQERPRLNLKPRTLPLPEIVAKPEEEQEQVEDNVEIEKQLSPEPESKPSGIPAGNVFGSAKPVDTAAREKEFEDRMEKLAQQNDELEKDQENDINEKFAEIHIAKDDKENKNHALSSWRRRDDESVSKDSRNFSPNRRGPPLRRNDDRRGNSGMDVQGGNRDRRSGDFNRGGHDRDNRPRDNRERIERNDRDHNNRDRRYNQDNAIQSKDSTQRDEKPKRDSRPERPPPKLQQAQSGPVLQTANKYSGLLDDDEDGSE